MIEITFRSAFKTIRIEDDDEGYLSFTLEQFNVEGKKLKDNFLCLTVDTFWDILKEASKPAKKAKQ